jgi:DNA polymerase IIIc chi subunit
MKEEEIKTRLIVTETIRQVQKLSELGEREFARVFYGIKDSDYNRDYVRSKYVFYQQEGFCRAYNRLDLPNQSRVLEYIMGEV